MSIFAVAAFADAPPSPPPTPEEFTIYTVTPGISGFIAFFILALIGWLLFRSLVRHMRKVDMAAAARDRAEQESAGSEQEAGAPVESAAGDEPAASPEGAPTAQEASQETGSGTATGPDAERPR